MRGWSFVTSVEGQTFFSNLKTKLGMNPPN